MRHWVNTVSLDHVRRGVEGGFTQADHGRSTRLRHLERGDRIVFYSPRLSYPDGEALRAFTALGEVVDDEPYQVQMSADFRPWRRRVRFEDVEQAPIAPLIPSLDFIANKRSWGMYFRRGLFAIERADFQRIAHAMGKR